MAGGCFISTERSLDDAVARVRLADDLGYEAVYVSHVNGRESRTVLTAYALATRRIRVDTRPVAEMREYLATLRAGAPGAG